MNLESGQLDKAQTMIIQGYRVGWRDWRPLITARRAPKAHHRGVPSSSFPRALSYQLSDGEG